jgi:riboflavin biosynthesis pyrimidine reductase
MGMSAAPASPQPTSAQPLRLRRLLPAGDPATAAEVVEELGLWLRPERPPGRPRVLLNMVGAVDGRATLQGRSAPLSGPADRELFHALRAPVDAVLVGAGTVRAERYGRLIPDEAHRALRVRRGLAEEPLACIVSSSLALAGDIPLLAEPAARVALLTPSSASLQTRGAELAYVRTRHEDTTPDRRGGAAPGRREGATRDRREGALDLHGALVELRERFDVRTVLCEGGPHLAGDLFAAGLVDELFLSLSPKLAGAPAAGLAEAERPSIVAGVALEPPLELELLEALCSESQLFLRYGVCACGRVSRETTPSSSLAR